MPPVGEVFRPWSGLPPLALGAFAVRRAIVGAFCSLAAMIAAYGWITNRVNSARALATHSLAASLVSSNNHPVFSAKAFEDWRLLHADEANAVLKQSKNLDICPSCRTQDGNVGDAWGNSLRIVVRKTNNPSPSMEFFVRSSGPDGVFSNLDDIVVPQEHQIEIERIGIDCSGN